MKPFPCMAVDHIKIKMCSIKNWPYKIDRLNSLHLSNPSTCLKMPLFHKTDIPLYMTKAVKIMQKENPFKMNKRTQMG